MKIAAMIQGIMTLPRRAWLIVSAIVLACGAVLAASHGLWAPEPAPSSTPAIPAAAVTIAAAPELPATADVSAGEPRRFLPQTREESVVLDVSSQGCFDGARPERFEIRGENPGVVRAIDPGDGSVLREIALDEDTRKELERTIAFYRAPAGDVICSTIDMVRVSFRQGDREVWSETYEDSSCETAYQGAPWSLAALFDAERQAGRDERMSRQPID